MIGDITSFFHNYQASKLSISNPSLTNVSIFVVLFAVTILSLRKSEVSSGLLDGPQTEQLKGLAVLLVILGHLWVHVAETPATILLSGEAVAVFFVLSGYGLTVSSKKTPLVFEKFWTRRIKRVMVPYWIATGLILLLDYLFLNRTYSAADLVMTSLGINMTPVTRHIDYVRWYVSLLLVWYLLFYLAMSKLHQRTGLVFLVAAAAVIFPLSYYARFSWEQIFAFPIGCAIGLYHDKLNVAWAKRPPGIVLIAVGGIAYVLAYKAVTSNATVNHALVTRVPNILLGLLYQVNSMVICVCLIIGLAYLSNKGYQSRFLLYVGKFAYELFLIHGAILVKYNPFIAGNDFLSVTGSFFVFLLFMLVVSNLMNKLAGVPYGNIAR